MSVVDKIDQHLNEKEVEDIQEKIKKFFKENPTPSDKEVHEYAESIGIDEHEFEEHIYAILGKLLKEEKHKDDLPGGLADKKNPEDYDQEELKLGIKIEMEHTDDKDLAMEIAMDHLEEIPDYYTRLIKMEKDAEKDKK